VKIAEGFAQQILDGCSAVNISVQIVFSGIAATQGIPTIGGQPCPGVNASGINPLPSDFAQFVAQYAPWFYDRGVRRFSLWNEPNEEFFLCAGKVKIVNTSFMQNQVVCNESSAESQAALYRDLYEAGFNTIRNLQSIVRIGQDIQIMFGELAAAAGGISFMQQVVKNGSLIADGVDIHPYQFCTPPNSKAAPTNSSPCHRWMVDGIAWVDEWQDAILTLAKSKLLVTSTGNVVPLYLTEFAYLIDPPPDNIPESYRSEWLPMAMEVAKKAGVKQMLVFGLFSSSSNNSWDSGLLTPTGDPLPSFLTLQAWAARNGYHQSP
jgi:hypothetical protein